MYTAQGKLMYNIQENFMDMVPPSYPVSDDLLIVKNKDCKWYIDRKMSKRDIYKNQYENRHCHERINPIEYMFDYVKKVEFDQIKIARQKAEADQASAVKKAEADKVAAAAKKIADQQAAEAKRLADQKADLAKKAADERAIAAKRLADQNATEAKRLAEENARIQENKRREEMLKSVQKLLDDKRLAEEAQIKRQQEYVEKQRKEQEYAEAHKGELKKNQGTRCKRRDRTGRCLDRY